jgi:hypothetical protein
MFTQWIVTPLTGNWYYQKPPSRQNQRLNKAKRAFPQPKRTNFLFQATQSVGQQGIATWDVDNKTEPQFKIRFIEEKLQPTLLCILKLVIYWAREQTDASCSWAKDEFQLGPTIGQTQILQPTGLHQPHAQLGRDLEIISYEVKTVGRLTSWFLNRTC